MKKNNYTLGIDLGTSSVKTVLFNTIGESIASASADYPLLMPHNGWAEQQPEDWFEGTVKTVRAVVEKSGVDTADIAGIGISGQMHGAVLLDGDGRALRPAILWCDGRTGRQCERITDLVGRSRLIEICANPALTGFTAGKLLWVRDNEPEVYRRCKTVLLPKDYLRFRLSGALASEISDASGTNLLDIKSGDWSGEILSALGLDRGMFPDICESADIAGYVTKEFSALTGLREGTPVVGGAGDNASAAVGVGCVTPENAMLTLGTSGVILAHSSSPVLDAQGRIHVFRSAVKGEYNLLSCTLAAGQSFKWFIDSFFAEEKKRDDFGAYIESLADGVPAGSDGLIFLPYIMGERSPILDECARGVFFGLSGIHGKADMLRAVMEGVAYSQRQCFEIMEDLGVKPRTIYGCGGGMKNGLWRQVLADNLNADISYSAKGGGDYAARGASILAFVGAGNFPTVQAACSAQMSASAPIMAHPHRVSVYDKTYEIYKALYPALKKSFKELSDVEL